MPPAKADPGDDSKALGSQWWPHRSMAAPLCLPARRQARPETSKLQPTCLLVPVERAPQTIFQTCRRAKTQFAVGPARVADPPEATGFGNFVAGQDPRFFAQASPTLGRKAY